MDSVDEFENNKQSAAQNMKNFQNEYDINLIIKQKS